MTKRTDTVMVFRRSVGVNTWRFWWRRKAGNGKIISGGLEGFNRLPDAIKAAKRANEGGRYDLCWPVLDRTGHLIRWDWEYAPR